MCLSVFVSYYCTQTHSVSPFLGSLKNQRLFLVFLGGFELEEPAGLPFLKKVFEGKKFVPFIPHFCILFLPILELFLSLVYNIKKFCF